MPEYKLEIKQVVDYPRCRMYRAFIQNLIADRSIRTDGCSGLFHFTVLCSYANFRTSYRRLDGITYTVYPGEWVCRLSELAEWLRLRSRRQVLAVLKEFQDRGLLRYTMLRRDILVKYRITDWARFNTILAYNCPCQKETGFFFLPVSTAMELVSAGKCSEMDIILDLWISAIYCDERVEGSKLGPVAYFRNGTGNPLVSYSELSDRWGISKATVGRMLKKLTEQGYISLFTFPGRHGSAIYLQNYLSTMFQISDVQIDKAEVAMCLNIKVDVPEIKAPSPVAVPNLSRIEANVSLGRIIVSKPDAEAAAYKALKVLAIQGVSCAGCPKSRYKLYSLSDDCKGKIEAETTKPQNPMYRLELYCVGNEPVYTFELTISEARIGQGGKDCGKKVDC